MGMKTCALLGSRFEKVTRAAGRRYSSASAFRCRPGVSVSEKIG
jgi:hypothetical protein